VSILIHGGCSSVALMYLKQADEAAEPCVASVAVIAAAGGRHVSILVHGGCSSVALKHADEAAEPCVASVAVFTSAGGRHVSVVLCTRGTWRQQ
jgi:hypothetical protein